MTRDLDLLPILQGKRMRDCFCILIQTSDLLTYQHIMHSLLAYHIYLMQMLSVQISACVRYLCTISEEHCGLFHQRNSKASFYPVLREAFFDSFSDTLM